MKKNKEDTTMKKNILSLAALLMASAAVFTACSNDDNITGEQPANPTGKYTMTINASKGGDATTRALSLGRNDANTKNVLNATWDENEVVLVYQNGSQIGTLYSAASATNETTLTGELSTPNAGQDLTLYFHTNATPSYAGQDGTLATIASSYDFCAPATITAGSFTVSGSTVSTTSSASFGANQQAIVKFTLKDKGNGDAAISATKLVISVGTTDYTITPASATSEIYAAIPGFTGQTVTLTATVGSDTYTYEKSGVSFTNGKYYEIGVKMTKQAAPATPLDNTTTAWTAGSYAVPAGGLTYSNAITVSGDVTLTLTDGETLTLNKGISIAAGATLTIQGNGAMVVNGTNNSTASTVAGSTGTLILTSGTLTATGGNGGNGAYESHGGNGGDAINGSVIVSGGTLTATGGNGGNTDYGDYESHGGNGGDAINGSVTVSGGTLTARGGNGGSVGDYGTYCSGGKGGDAISGTLTINGGSTSVNDGSNGSLGSGYYSSTAGTGGKGHN